MSQKRRYPRYLTLKMGHIASEALSLDCAVLNVSIGGACLLVSDAGALPDAFNLTIDGDARECTVAWREQHRLGVSFAHPTLGENEIPATVNLRTAGRRDDVLRVAELFLRGAASFTEQQVELFDNVMHHLIDITESRALAKLSVQMAPVERGPVRVIQRLANDDDIAVSGPVLEQSPVLADDFLVRIARSKSQAHLMALAGRICVTESVTDILVDRGNQNVARKVSANDGARFSKIGFHKLATRARSDDELVVRLAQRPEVPADVFKSLLRQVGEPLRKKLMNDTDPAVRKRVAQALVASPPRADKAAPHKSVGSSTDIYRVDPGRDEIKGQLVEAARAGHLSDTIQALSMLSQVPPESVRNLVNQGAEEGVLVLCKAAGLGWPDAKNVLTVMMTRKSRVDFKEAFERYIAFSHDTAQRGLRYIKARRTASTEDIRRML